MARIIDDRHLVTVPSITCNDDDDDDDDDSPQQITKESCFSLSYILNANQLDMYFQND